MGQIIHIQLVPPCYNFLTNKSLTLQENNSDQKFVNNILNLSQKKYFYRYFLKNLFALTLTDPKICV